MKRCPKCRRDYYDETLLYCLDDGSTLLDGPALKDEAPTAILSSVLADGDAKRRDDPERQELHREPPPSRARGPGKVLNRLGTYGVAAIILAVVSGIAYFGPRLFDRSAERPVSSIAVLPFQNRAADAETEYLSDGLAESLIYRLSQFPNLRVSPTSSVFRYKGKEIDPERVGADLGVDAVMSGRIVQRGESFTLSVNLVDVRYNKVLWGEHYERKMSEVLATQREIAAEIAQKLQLKLSGEGEKALTNRSTDNNEAYKLYLRGRYHYAKRTRDDMDRSVEYYRQAIELDPRFPLAYAGIADTYNSMPSYGYRSPKEVIPEARLAAKRALEIDPTLAEAHSALANSLLTLEWNWAEADREFRRAIELNPNVANIHHLYARQYLLPMRRTAEAVKEMERAVELEPLTLTINSNLARAYLNNKQNDRALAQARKTLDLEPTGLNARYQLGIIYNALGMFEEAVNIAEESLRMDPKNQLFLQITGVAYANAGRLREAQEIIKRYEVIEQTQYVSHYAKATVYTAMGEKEKAFAELEKAFREPRLAFAAINS